MILFIADNHYDTHAGRVLYECVGDSYDMEFVEDDWACLQDDTLPGRCSLIILNAIGGTCDVPLPDSRAESIMRRYVEKGGNLLLLHGGSAAFWHWDWWRRIVGYRWVREDDPDGLEPSTHPVRPYAVHATSCEHPLCRKLQDVELPEDEIYMNLAHACPTTTLMETTTDEGTFPMCYEATTPWGGRVLGYLPGHRPQVVRHPGNISNCRALIDYLVGDRSRPAADTGPATRSTSQNTSA